MQRGPGVHRRPGSGHAQRFLKGLGLGPVPGYARIEQRPRRHGGALLFLSTHRCKYADVLYGYCEEQPKACDEAIPHLIVPRPPGAGGVPRFARNLHFLCLFACKRLWRGAEC